jgi:hypothetical protein
MDIEINFINQSNDANNSQVVIFGDDGDTPVATHSVRVAPRTAVRVTHSSLPSGGRLEVSPPLAGAAGFFLPDMAAPLHGCVTIDATTPDGYLDKVRGGNPQAATHQDVASAVANLVACARSLGPACIAGHGAPGLMSLGGGGATTPGKVLDPQAVDQWGPQLAPLKGLFEGLVLYAPQVGSGQEGAQLLFQIAQIIEAPVYGPTGVLYCDNEGLFSLEPHSVWQVATPNFPPAPIDPPVQALLAERPPAKA